MIRRRGAAARNRERVQVGSLKISTSSIRLNASSSPPRLNPVRTARPIRTARAGPQGDSHGRDVPRPRRAQHPEAPEREHAPHEGGGAQHGHAPGPRRAAQTPARGRRRERVQHQPRPEPVRERRPVPVHRDQVQPRGPGPVPAHRERGDHRRQGAGGGIASSSRCPSRFARATAMRSSRGYPSGPDGGRIIVAGRARVRAPHTANAAHQAARAAAAAKAVRARTWKARDPSFAGFTARRRRRVWGVSRGSRPCDSRATASGCRAEGLGTEWRARRRRCLRVKRAQLRRGTRRGWG